MKRFVLDGNHTQHLGNQSKNVGDCNETVLPHANVALTENVGKRLQNKIRGSHTLTKHIQSDKYLHSCLTTSI